MANTVTLRFIGDTSDIQKSFGVVQAETGKAESKFAQFSKRMAPIAAAAGGAIALHFGKASIDAYKESEAAQNRLEQAFAKFPKLADSNIGSMRKLNTQLAQKTKFDDDATASGQAVLAQFGLTGKQIKTLTPLLQDYAAKTGKDLPGAAQDLGKAMLGQGRALKAIGINFKDTGSAAGNFAQLTGDLRGAVGGFAEAEGKTAAGQAQRLSNQFGELQEKVGAALVPALQKLADIGLKVIGFFQGLPGPVQAALGVFGGLIVAVLGISKAIQAWTAIQAALNAVLALNPIILIVGAIALLAAGVYIAYQKFQPFHDAVDKAWQLLQSGFQWIQSNWPLLLAILTGPIGLAVLAITRNFDTIVSFVQGLPGKISAAASGMWDGIKNAFKSVINWIIRAWNGLDFTLPSVEVFGKKIGGFTLGTPDIPQLAEGGIVTRPTLALIGERGPEAVLPLGRGVGGNVYNLTVHASGTQEGKLAGAEVVAAIARYERANGKGWRSA